MSHDDDEDDMEEIPEENQGSDEDQKVNRNVVFKASPPSSSKVCEGVLTEYNDVYLLMTPSSEDALFSAQMMPMAMPMPGQKKMPCEVK